MSNCSAISWWEQDEMMMIMLMMSALYWTNRLKFKIYSVSWLIQQSAEGRPWFRANHVLLILLIAVCLAERQQIKYQFYSLWFDPNGARINDLPHCRQAHFPLHHRCSRNINPNFMPQTPVLLKNLNSRIWIFKVN